MPKNTFHLPPGTPQQQLAHCIRIIQIQRDELLPIREKLNICQLNKYNSDIAADHWRKKYHQAEEEIERLKEDKEKLEKEKGQLIEEIEKLTKTNNRYQVALFDHGNFKHPDKSGKKKKGGQFGHANTNKDHERNYASFRRQRLYAAACGNCGSQLTRTKGISKKILIDIEINPKLIQVLIESERQWCGKCRAVVRASHPQSLPFTEFGINTFMTIMHLRFKGKQSLRTIACTLNNLFGLEITKSGVGTILFQAKEYLEEKYEELKQAIRDGDLMYNDETGWMVRGKSAWMWLMASPDRKHADGTIETGVTIYVAAESRGKDIFKEMYGNSQAKSMHDGNASYESVTGEKNSAYCWSHVLRYAYEETVKLPSTHQACFIRDRLVDLYQTIRAHIEYTSELKEKILRSELDSIILIQSTDKTVNNILHRVRTQKEGLILALLITEDGTNNLGEREFRELVASRNISYGSDTYTGMEVTAILFSIVKTIMRDRTRPFLPTLRSYLQEGIRKKCSQYKHIPILAT